ncbi:transposable element Tcb1 transposase [Trichonephila clavipes]|nr:transposable element Tcb1 transposase [Trichonephila clavipes]
MWAAEWNEVVFTDESRICLQHHDGRIRVWRHRGEWRLNSCVMHRHTGSAPGIMDHWDIFQGKIRGIRRIQICITTHSRKPLNLALGGGVHKSILGNRHALPLSFELSLPTADYGAFYKDAIYASDLRIGTIVTSVQEESNLFDDETDEDEDNNNESRKGPSNADAFSALVTAMKWYEQQSECCPTQLLLLKRIRDLEAKKRRSSMVQ